MHLILKRLKDKIEGIFPFVSFDKPIFIIAAPRSGSTFLFECLIQFDELFHISYEADLIWWNIFPYERLKHPSDYIDGEEATEHNIYKLKRALRARAVLNTFKLNKKTTHIPYLLGIKPIRYIDKTISNCFHLNFIERAFPDARYILLLRDPRPNISSMIEGWNHSFTKPQLTKILMRTKKPRIRHWSYPAAPGWQKVVSQPLPVICAWSWKKHVEYSLSFFKNGKKDVTVVKYEDLVANPVNIITGIADRFDLKMNQKIKVYLQKPRLSSTTISSPDPEKWKKRKKDIESILPYIDKLANEIGYDLALD